MKTTALFFILMIIYIPAVMAQGTAPTDSDNDGRLEVSGKQHLKYLSENANADMSADYEQTQDIILDDTDYESGGIFEGGFTPIGWNVNYPEFTGEYDGQGYIIKNLQIDVSNPNKPVGFFAKIGFYNDGYVHNFGLVEISLTSIGDGGSDLGVGGLTGTNKTGSIEQCFVSGEVKGVDFVGGLVGRNDGEIKRSHYNGIVKGEEENAGGLIGGNEEKVTNCYARADVTRLSGGSGTKFGSFAGDNFYGTIENSYSTGSVFYENESNPTGKGLVGEDDGGTYTNLYFDKEVSNQDSDYGATGKTTSEMKDINTYSNWSIAKTSNLSGEPWGIDDNNKNINSGYPYLNDGNDEPLPVTWLSFSGRRNDKSKVTLHWSTASEQNNDRFEIQRSEEGEDFTTIGKRKGAGNSNEVIKYQYTDTDAPEGTVYYRLKQVDYNGACEYSDIVAVQSKGEMQEGSLSIYPNPVSDRFNLQLPEYEGTMQVEVYNMTGQQVYQKEISKRQSLIIPSAGWPEGVYLTICRTPYNVLEKRIIKQ